MDALAGGRRGDDHRDGVEREERAADHRGAVEQGKIDLQADVNTYLTGFQIPDTYPQPITMLDLMSHTAGFGEISWHPGKIALEELNSLEEFLKEYMPARVYPPGQVPAYSNYGTSLAGYIVEQVSGEPYEQYVETHILGPLGMRHSTMRQPLPAELAQNMSQSYLFNDGSYQPFPFPRVYNPPAGVLAASGTDMGYIQNRCRGTGWFRRPLQQPGKSFETV